MARPGCGRKKGEALLLSEYGLDVKPYHEDFSADVRWEDCSLRQWLNGAFYENAFTDEERQKIVLSESEGFPKYNSRVPGQDYDKLERETEDYVFLLSYTEVCQYFDDDAGDGSNEDRLCYPTAYAKNCETLYLNNSKGSCGWWLCAGSRTANGTSHPFVVSAYGGIDAVEQTGLDSVACEKYAVRPAMWIKL